MNKDIELNVSVDEMVWIQDQARWKVTLSTGEVISARFMVMATGLLSSTKKVEFEGSDEFKALELYVASRSNGLMIETPSVRN